ncbi:MAG TPA: hypothetical protein VIM12_13745 [Noviherbaspirillum sp.]|uniref:hypothetical protein n=1 Tax=Noviherbaspirillum sp. TaxID=1926288 RepID=UPI002F95607F
MRIESAVKGKTVTSDEIVEALTLANTSQDNPQNRHMFREALRALVRLSKAEKIRDLQQATGNGACLPGMRPPGDVQ